MDSEFDIFLASSSPRRAELLSQVGIRFQVLVPAIDERQRVGEPPAMLVERLACEKAAAGQRIAATAMVPESLPADSTTRIPPSLGTALRPVLGADTVVVCDGHILGKPDTLQEARSMLARLSGTTHSVYSAVAIRSDTQCLTACSKTLVTFRNLSESERDLYVRSGEPMGKAGGYAIQGLGACFVKVIHGSYSGVVGLPLMETCELLSRFGIHCLRPLEGLVLYPDGEASNVR